VAIVAQTAAFMNAMNEYFYIYKTPCLFNGVDLPQRDFPFDGRAIWRQNVVLIEQCTSTITVNGTAYPPLASVPLPDDAIVQFQKGQAYRFRYNVPLIPLQVKHVWKLAEKRYAVELLEHCCLVNGFSTRFIQDGKWLGFSNDEQYRKANPHCDNDATMDLLPLAPRCYLTYKLFIQPHPDHLASAFVLLLNYLKEKGMRRIAGKVNYADAAQGIAGGEGEQIILYFWPEKTTTVWKDIHVTWNRTYAVMQNLPRFPEAWSGEPAPYAAQYAPLVFYRQGDADTRRGLKAPRFWRLYFTNEKMVFYSPLSLFSSSDYGLDLNLFEKCHVCLEEAPAKLNVCLGLLKDPKKFKVCIDALYTELTKS